MPLDKNIQVNISTLTIVKLLLVVLGVFFLYTVKEVIGVVFIAWVLASALDPLVDRLKRYKIPRALSILGVYLLIILIIVLVFYLLIPPLAEQIKAMTVQLPDYLSQIAPDFLNQDNNWLAKIQENLKYVSENLGKLTSGLYSAVTSIFGAFATFVIILVITFYMTVEEEGIKRFFRSLAPLKYQPYLIQKINRVQEKMGSWLWGELLLMLVVGFLAGLSMWILGLKYFLVLGLLAALFEVVPIIGPILASLPAIFFAFSDRPLKALLVIIIYVVIQQIENQILVPKIMNKAVGLNPIIVLVTVLIGAKIAGLIGVILAVPTATIISIFLEDFFQKKEIAGQLEEKKL